MILSEAVLDVAGAAICAVDPEGRVALWNQAAAALTGISPDRLDGHTFQQILLFPEDIAQWKREFDRISGGAVPRHVETRWKKRDGSPLFLTSSCSAIRDSVGDVRYFVCTSARSLSREFITDRIEELRNMSRFLHNTISQDLVALSWNVSFLDSAALEPSAHTHASEALSLIDRCCRYIRVMSFMLAPPSPPETALEASIGQYTDYMREEAGLAVIADIDPVPVTVPLEVQLLLFAALQKWIVQGIRTRRRPRISVSLKSRGACTVLEMETLSDASLPPMEPQPSSPHAGWAVIRDRIIALDGEFYLAAESTRVFARISLPV